ncbi:MAG: hypothetical protein ACRC46_06895 [Thermoguttaceae bacterium]
MNLHRLPSLRRLAIHHDFVVYVVLSFVLAAGGCASYQPFTQQLSWELKAPTHNNPVFIETDDYQNLWETICAVVALQQFDIVEDTPIRRYDSILTEGRLATAPKIGATIAEPWHSDSATMRKRLEATFQTIQRRVIIRAVPEGNGFLVEVIVYEELEALEAPAASSTSHASLRFENVPQTITSQIDRSADRAGWIVVGRDGDFEKRLLGEILFRFERRPLTLRNAVAPRK